MNSRTHTNKTIAEYNFCVERGTSFATYFEFVDANEDPIYIDYYDFSLILKPNKYSPTTLYQWNTSTSVEPGTDGIHKMTPFESGNFNMILTDDFTESINFQELYYNIQITSASMEDELLEGGIRFVTEQQ